jgi:hypothetical protein
MKRLKNEITFESVEESHILPLTWRPLGISSGIDQQKKNKLMHLKRYCSKKKKRIKFKNWK